LVQPNQTGILLIIRFTFRIDFANGSQICHGKIRPLELIAQHGSISRAAKEINMPYRRARPSADEINRRFKTPMQKRIMATPAADRRD
jgi:molybdate transport system regulatory protein